MLKPFLLPELAEGIASAVVVAVNVSVGDKVDAEEIVAELENDKATAELPVPFSGIVKEIHAAPGDEIAVGAPLMSIEVDGANDTPAPAPAAPPAETPKVAPPSPESSVPVPSAPPAPVAAPAAAPPSPAKDTPRDPDAVLPAGPEVRRLAREFGVDLKEITGTGPRGRIVPEDVRTYTRKALSASAPSSAAAGVAATPGLPPLPDFTKWGAVEVTPMSGVRRKTAEIVTQSWQNIPHVVQYDRADITDLGALRKAWQKRGDAEGGKVTVTAILLKVVAAALKVFPRFNCSIDMDNHKIVYKKYVHLAVAVDAGHGLLTPVLRDADRQSVLCLAASLGALSAKARDKQLTVDEMAGSTFAVSNLGGLGTLSFSPIVTWPHVAVLGVGKADTVPVWDGESFAPRKLLPLCLSYDHRANDGADAARFLRWIAEAIEDPMKIIVEAG